MKKNLIVFPGTFCPPTYGHHEIVKMAAEIFPCGVTIMASANPDKDNWFTQEERAAMWQAYDLPSNVRVTTLDQMQREEVDFTTMVMVRGIRNQDDYIHEQSVMELNFNGYGISKYFYIMTTGEFRELSSSRARAAASELRLADLAKYVPPQIAGQLLEYVLQAKNIFLVVGRPGSGKSTWLKSVVEVDPSAYHLDGDQLNKELRPELVAAFPGVDLIELAMTNEAALLEVLAPKWLALLGERLKQVPPGRNVYVEAAYGLEANKQLYRYLGSKVIHVGCQDPAVNQERIAARGTSRHQAFVEKIPDLCESVMIAASEKLSHKLVDTSGSLEDLKQTTKDFVSDLHQGTSS